MPLRSWLMTSVSIRYIELVLDTLEVSVFAYGWYLAQNLSKRLFLRLAQCLRKNAPMLSLGTGATFTGARFERSHYCSVDVSYQ